MVNLRANSVIGQAVNFLLQKTLKIADESRQTMQNLRSDETLHRPHRPQIFNILLTSNRSSATVCVYAMSSI